MSAKGALCWYRVVFRDGKQQSVRAVERAASDAGTQTVYVQARDAEEAGRLAWRQVQLADSRRRRAAYLAEGKCQWCGRKQDRKPKQRCSVCEAGRLGHRERSKARARGEVVPPPQTHVTRQRNREVELERVRYAARLEALEDVRGAWAIAEDVSAFAKWLKAEIDRLRGRKVA